MEVVELDKAPVSITLIQPTAVNIPFPQHARNYMEREPRLLPPVITPQQVAEAILKAAAVGGRDIKVGAMAVFNTAISNLIPSLGDKMSAKRGVNQQENIPPLHPQGALYEPGESGSATVRYHLE